jgi:hypothetical protein
MPFFEPENTILSTYFGLKMVQGIENEQTGSGPDVF